MKLEIRQTDGQVLLVGNSVPSYGGTITEISDALLPILTGDGRYTDYKWDGTQFILNKVGNIHRDREKEVELNDPKIKAFIEAIEDKFPMIRGQLRQMVKDRM